MVEPPKHYTVKRLAERWSCAQSFVYKQIAEKKLPCMKFGNAIRIRETDILDYEERGLEWHEKNEIESNIPLSLSTEEKISTLPGQKIANLNAFQRGQMIAAKHKHI